MITRLLEFILPKSMRQRPAAEPEANDQVLTHLADTHRVYRAMLDHAFAQFEAATMKAIEPGLSAPEREYHAGRAYALMAYIESMENLRTRLHEREAQQQARLAKTKA